MPRTGNVLRHRKGIRRGLALALFLTAAGARAGQVELISQMDPVPDSFGNSAASAMSADGRYVLFQSEAPNLVPSQVDDNFSTDLFLRDRVTGTTTLVSHAAGKPNVAGHAAAPLGKGFQTLAAGLSADGRYVAFASAWTDLVAGVSGTNGAPQAYLYDRVTGATTLVSHAIGNPAAMSGPVTTVRISADGSYVAFSSGVGSSANVYLYQRSSGTVTLVSHRSGAPTTPGSGSSLGPVISADGGYVAFLSDSGDLLPVPPGSPGRQAVFLYERATGLITLVSHAAGSSLELPDRDCFGDPISADGRWVAFLSAATNLIAGLAPVPALNLFLYDRISGNLRLVSHTTASPLTPGGAESLAMSADGRYLAFDSQAPDLIPGQVNPAGAGYNLFVYDRVADAISLVSHAADSPATTTAAHDFYAGETLSADGRYIAFVSAAEDLVSHQTDVPDTLDVFIYDQSSRTTVLASHLRTSLTTAGNGGSPSALISADGSTVAFASHATDLAEGRIDPNGFQDLYVFDRSSAEVTDLTRRDPGATALSPAGPSSAEGLSADGRYAVFTSLATGLVPGQVDLTDAPDPFGQRFGTRDVFLRDLATGKNTLLSRSQAAPPTAASGSDPAISADGNYAVFNGPDPSGFSTLGRLWVYDRAADTLTLANHPPGTPGQADGRPQYQPALSADGRWIAYTCSGCHSLVAGQQDGQPDDFRALNVFLYDRLTGTNTLVSHTSGSTTTTGNRYSFYPRISADGRFVVFTSDASDLVAGLTGPPNNLYLYDRDTGAVSLVTHAAGSPLTGTGGTFTRAVLSADGRWIVYESSATNLVPGQIDTNDDFDVFLYDRVSDVTTLVSHSALSAVTAGNNREGSLDSSEPVGISADGRWIVFINGASDLVPGVVKPDPVSTVYLYDRTSGQVTLVSSAAGSPNLARAAFEPEISADGSRIAFLSLAADLVPGQSGGPALNLFVQERATGLRTLAAPVSPYPYPYTGGANVSIVPRLSADGRKIAFTTSFQQVDGDLNNDWDAYLYDGTVAPPGGPVTLPPCNLFSGALRSNARKVLTVAGACGVPAGAKQVVVKLTVSQGTGKGNVQVYPGNVTNPSSGILRFNKGAARSAGFTVPLGNGGIALLPFVNGNGTVRVGVEIDGYTP